MQIALRTQLTINPTLAWAGFFAAKNRCAMNPSPKVRMDAQKQALKQQDRPHRPADPLAARQAGQEVWDCWRRSTRTCGAKPPALWITIGTAIMNAAT